MKKLLIFLLVFIISSSLGVYSQTMFERTYGGEGNEFGKEILENDNGEYIVIGGASLLYGSPFKAYMMKLDENGDQIWSKFFGDESSPATSIHEISTSSYLLTVNLRLTGFDDPGYSLVKIDNNGEITWSSTYGEYTDNVYDSEVNNNGEYILFGDTWSCSNMSEFFLVKISQEGEILWIKTFDGFGENDYGSAIEKTPDGGFILVGSTDRLNGIEKNFDIYAIKTDSNGNKIWENNYGGNDNDWGEDVIQSYEGGFIIAATSKSFGDDNYDIYIINIDINGDVLWTKTIGGDEYDGARKLGKTTDGNYVLCGTTSSIGFGSKDLYLIKFDPDGNILWSQYYGGTEDDNGVFVRETSDGGFILTGYTESFTPENHNDIYVIKTNEYGNITSGEIEMTMESLIPQNSPNPFTTQTIIEYDLKQPEKISLMIYNQMGKQVYQTEKNQSQGKQQLIWNAEGYADGIYYYKLEAGEQIYKGKLVKIN